MMFEVENDLKEALRNSEAQHRLLFEHANVEIFIAQDRYLKIPNPCLSQILGFSRAELEEQPFKLFIYPEYLPLVNMRHQERLSGKTDLPQTYDFRVIAKNGTIIWVQLSTVLIQLKGRSATLKKEVSATPLETARSSPSRPVLILTIHEDLFNDPRLAEANGCIIKDINAHMVIKNLYGRPGQ